MPLSNPTAKAEAVPADLLAWTAGYDALARPLGVLDRTPANLLLFTFCDPRARSAYPEWDAVADEQGAARLARGHRVVLDRLAASRTGR